MKGAGRLTGRGSSTGRRRGRPRVVHVRGPVLWVATVTLLLAVLCPVATTMAASGAAPPAAVALPTGGRTAATTAGTGTGATSGPASPTQTTTATTTATRPPTDTETTLTATTTAPATTVTATVTQTAVPAQPVTTPALEDSGISLVTGLLAVAVLAMAGLVLWLLHRREPQAAQTARAPLPQPARPTTAAGLTPLLSELGEAMIDASYPVNDVQDVLHEVAEANGIRDAEIIVLPTALLVTVPGQSTVETAAQAAGLAPLRLDQVNAVTRVVDAAQSGQAPALVLHELRRIRLMPAPVGQPARVAGYMLLSAGLSLILHGGLLDLLVAAALGAFMGALLLGTARLGPAWLAVRPVVCAFATALAVFLLGRLLPDLGVMPPLVAPLITLLPGALLTVSVLELATGQIVSGAGRLAAGALQLVLLALGIVGAAQLVGVPAIQATAASPLGDLGPWLGVAVFSVGVVIHHCLPRSSLGWVLLMLYVAYGAQILGGLFLGAQLSAFVGALVVSPVAAFIARFPSGPSTQVSFLPAFWLLVPGSLGLVGVTMLLGADRDAFSSLYTTAVTMVAVSFGVLIGRATTVWRRPAGASGR